MAQDYARRIDDLLRPYTGEGMQLSLSTQREAKQAIAELTNVQKQLRLIKKEIGLSKKEVRAEYAEARADLSSQAVGNRFAGRGFFGKLVRANTANKRASLQKNQQADLAPFERLEAYIDEKIIALDRAKLKIEQGMVTLPK